MPWSGEPQTGDAFRIDRCARCRGWSKKAHEHRGSVLVLLWEGYGYFTRAQCRRISRIFCGGIETAPVAVAFQLPEEAQKNAP